MERERFPRISAALPRRGHALVTISVVDEGGFTYQYETIEAPLGAVRDSLAALQLQATTAERTRKRSRRA